MKTKTSKSKKAKKVKPLELGRNIRAPRLLEDGENVYFIQSIYGLSMCFGRGYVERAYGLPAGYVQAEGEHRVQYIIKGERWFYHNGSLTKDRGTFNTWMGAAKVVIVPRNEKTAKWFEAMREKWEGHCSSHRTLLKEMKFK